MTCMIFWIWQLSDQQENRKFHLFEFISQCKCKAGCCKCRVCMISSSQIFFFDPILICQWECVCSFYICSHSTEASVFLSSLVSAVKLHLFLLSRSHPSRLVQLCFERVVRFNVIVWFHRISPPLPLKKGRADWSWVIPAVSPSLGKTWVSPTTRAFSDPSAFFLLLQGTGTNSCQHPQIFRAPLRLLARWSQPGGVCPGWGLRK